MQKKIIALAIASALTVPALAMADTSNVTVYGIADVSLDRIDNGDSTAGIGGATTTGVSVGKVSSNSSRIGLKGSEDLGDGLKAVWQIETAVDIDAAANTLGGRPTFAGLAGSNWGQVTLGRHESSYKTSTRAMDMFYDHIADNRTLMGVGSAGVGSFDSRNTNSIRYDSPDMSGFKVSGLYAFNSEANRNTAAAGAAAASGDYKAKTVSLSGNYSANGISGALAYQKNDLSDATGAAITRDERAWKIAGGYATEQFAVNAIYEDTDDNLGAAAGGLGHKAYYLGGKFNATANDAIKLSYTKAKKVDDATATGTDTGAKQWSLGVDHSMSKRTTVYAMYTKLDNEAGADYVLTSLGSTAGAHATPGVNGVGADQSAFSFGMKHSF